MYSDIFCKVYNEFGWNYYPEAFAQQLFIWMEQNRFRPRTCLDLACGTGILCRLLDDQGIAARGMDYSAGMIDIARAASPHIPYDVADMVTYRPEERFDLVTCTGDALNHILRFPDVEQIFANVYACLDPGGYFIFDLLNEREVSDSVPFEMDFDPRTRVWFQMTRPGETAVCLTIRVWEDGALTLEEQIRETIHDPEAVCAALARAGFTLVKCGDCLPEGSPNHGTTWFLVARKDP